MASLLTGLDVALYMTNRLKAYREFSTRLPAGLATSQFEEALVEFYALILRFLANAIEQFQKGTTRRALEALWKTEEIQNFEAECDKVAIRTEIEAQNCDRALGKNNFDLVHGDLLKVLSDIKDLHSLKTLIGVLQDKIDLGKLPVVKSAAFDSYEESRLSQCLEHTRVDLLQRVMQWADDPQAEAIYWLNGMAGTGKSTISRTVAQKFHDQGKLGATFLFKRGEGDRGSARKFFTTLAAQLAWNSPIVQRRILDALDAKPGLPDKSLTEQFERLILGPVSGQTSPAFVVIDALDECERDDDIRTILSLLEKAKLHLRLFITSRRDLAVRLGFADLTPGTYQNVLLHEITKTTVKHDINLYLEHEFDRLRADDLKRQPQFPLPPNWPGSENIQTLVELAVPLFIFAATVCGFIAEPRGDPENRLDAILRNPQSLSTSKLDRTYQPILNQLLNEGKRDDQLLIDDFKELVGPIVVFYDPLSVDSIASLLDMSKKHVSRTLDWLHSVLDIPEDSEVPIRLFHLSFRDFLVDPKKRGQSEFCIDEQGVHKFLAEQCLKLLSKRLKRDLCELSNPGKGRVGVSQQHIEASIPDDVSYACRYWVHHCYQGMEPRSDLNQVLKFLKEHFLHWMEALSWLGLLSELIAQIGILRSFTNVGIIPRKLSQSKCLIRW